ncbi:MAG: cation diffusion facilitator family transporter [Porphyromonadaceae bacterium]|nr:cation diffusion facilitator family transporter [Porphyromonadaceae bacterium]
MISAAPIKQKTQGFVLFCSTLLMIGKFIAYYITDSSAIFTDALESIANVAAGAMSLYCIRLAARPKNKSYPFGHGKIEMISASMEGIFIIIAGIIIIYHGIERIFTPGEISSLDIGICITAAASIINFLLGMLSIKIGNSHNSEALIAEGKHLQSDTYSTIALVAGLILVRITGLIIIDSLMAVIFGGIIIYTAITILHRTFATLTDQANPERLSYIADILNKHRQDDWIDIHNLKILEYGSYSFIDCDLTLPWYYTVEQGHNACEFLGETLSRESNEKITFSVHADSCNELHCHHCLVNDCKYRRNSFVAKEPINLNEIVESDEEYNKNENSHNPV